jgi:hypothetical protein
MYSYENEDLDNEHDLVNDLDVDDVSGSLEASCKREYLKLLFLIENKC